MNKDEEKKIEEQKPKDCPSYCHKSEDGHHHAQNKTTTRACKFCGQTF